ncbi:MAG: hypothetical protein FWG98_12530 [Candidatus Cloacimonetes bacterium]|nr:hypothetical protein [Candidatus Cloacimonadota bacterium]
MKKIFLFVMMVIVTIGALIASPVIVGNVIVGGNVTWDNGTFIHACSVTLVLLDVNFSIIDVLTCTTSSTGYYVFCDGSLTPDQIGQIARFIVTCRNKEVLVQPYVGNHVVNFMHLPPAPPPTKQNN